MPGLLDMIGAGGGNAPAGSNAPGWADLLPSVGLDPNAILQQAIAAQAQQPALSNLGGGGGGPQAQAQPTYPANYGFSPLYAPQGSLTASQYANALNPGNALDYSNYSGTSPFGGNQGYPSNWQQFQTGNTGTTGGFFTAADLDRANWNRLQQAAGPQQAVGAAGGPATGPQYSLGQGGLKQSEGWGWGAFSPTAPSTNNWRLLPPQYRNPNYIMRNGMIIDLTAARTGGPAGGQTAAYVGTSDSPNWSKTFRPNSPDAPAPWVSGETWPLAPKQYYWPGGPVVGAYTGQME